MATMAAKLVPFLFQGESTGGVPGIIIILGVIVIAYFIFIKNAKR